MPRTVFAAFLCSALLGCVRENPDARLDEQLGVDRHELAAMLKLDCSQRREEVQLARDESQTDFDRIANYRLALKAFSGGAEKIEAAFSKQPDLLYISEGDALRTRLQRCQAQAATFTIELRKFEQEVKFRPAAAETEAAPVKAAVAPAAAPAKIDAAFDDAPVKKSVKATKKSKKAKAAYAKRKKLGRVHAVLADARSE